MLKLKAGDFNVWVTFERMIFLKISVRRTARRTWEKKSWYKKIMILQMSPRSP